MNIAQPSQNSAAVEATEYPTRWMALVVLLTGGFMNIMDITVVNVALPSLQTAFNATSSEIEWVAAAYILAFALCLMPFGRLGDRIGRKQMFLVGISAFAIMSAACGLAQSMPQLIGARVLQGISAAMIMPQILASVQVIFPPQERFHAMSYFGLAAGLAAMTGPLAGGLLIGANLFDLGWRWIFLINIPVGLLVVLAGRSIIPQIAGHAEIRNDWGGMALAGLFVFCLIFPLVEGHSLGWPDWVFAMMALAAPLLGVFILFERWRERRTASTLVPLSIMTDRNFGLGSVMILLVFSGSMGSFLPMTLFLQQGFGFSPLQAGLTTAPFAVGILAGSQINRALDNRWPRARLAVGGLAYCAGVLTLRFMLNGVEDEISAITFIGPLFVSGIGMNLAIAAIMRTAMNDIPPSNAGSGSGTLQTFQNLGSAFGVAIAGQIFFSTLAGTLAGGAGEHPAYVAGLQAAFIYSISAFFCVALLAWFLKPPAIPEAPIAGSPPPVGV